MSLPVMRGNISGSTEVPLASAIAPGDPAAPAGAFFSEPEQNRPANPLNWGFPVRSQLQASPAEDMGQLDAEEPRELGDGGRGWPMARGSLHLSMFVQGDHLYDERDVGNIRVLVADDHRLESNVVEVDRQGEGERVVAADPVRRMDPTGNLEGEVLVEHHRQLVDAIDVDAQGECSSVFVRCHLDDERQGQDVTKGKLRHPDRALEPGPNIECPGSRIHLGMIGDEGALDLHQNVTRTAWSVSYRRAACGHCPLVHGRRLGSSPDVDSRVTPIGTMGIVD